MALYIKGIKMVDSTRLRYIEAKKLESLIAYVNKLPYKIEIKGNPIVRDKKWFLFFIPPDSTESKEIPWGKID